jgi:hypothetical protein
MAAVALLGLIVVSAAGLVVSTQQEAERVAHDEETFDERWLAAAQLRADVEGARAARLSDGWLLLEPAAPGPAGPGGRGRPGGPAVAWRVEPAGIVRHGGFTRRYRIDGVAPFSVERRGGTDLVAWEWGSGESASAGRAAVGGAS